MSLILWLGLELAGPFILKRLVSSGAVYEASVQYLSSRSWGITFALISLAFRALFIGVAIGRHNLEYICHGRSQCIFELRPYFRGIRLRWASEAPVSHRHYQN
ncbi:MAG: hypothetical protein R2850_13785 [Bacteroidia bacterium]